MDSELYIVRDLPFDLFDINLVDATDEQLMQISDEQGIGLTLDEMKVVQRYFSKIGRTPSIVDLQCLGQEWSTHCSHKDFKGLIMKPDGGLVVDSMLKSYIKQATEEINSPNCFRVFDDNAAIIRLGDTGYGIAFKVETHNHPTMIDPFEGAATGLGGLVRDIMGVGAEPIGGIFVYFSGPFDYDSSKLLGKDIKHPTEIFKGAIEGIAHYAKGLGTPVLSGAVHFDESYTGNVGVFAGGIGLIPLKAYVRDAKPGDAAVLAGNKTGRDGVHGVIFASRKLGAEEEEKEIKGEIEEVGEKIPKGNPELEQRIIRALIKARNRGLYSALTDLGGGGISCATTETAYNNECGIDVYLDRVLLKYPMKLWDIFVSETQERMFFAVRPENIDEFVDTFGKEGAEATVIGKFTPKDEKDRKMIRLYNKVNDEVYKVGELDLDFVLNPPKATRVVKWTAPALAEPKFGDPGYLGFHLKKLLAAPNIASKEAIINAFDGELYEKLVLKPTNGKYGGPNDAAVIKPLENHPIGVVVSCGTIPNYGKINPYWMGAAAVDEAVRNNVAVGGRDIVIAGNFMSGDPNNPQRMAEIEMSCRGYCDAAKSLGVPPVTGKDSLYNESVLGSVTPTLVITAVGQIPDASKAVSAELKRFRDGVYMIGKTYPELGGSEYYRFMRHLGSSVPEFRGKDARKTMNALTAAIDAGYINACHDCSEGGLGVAAAEMALSGDYGLDIDLNQVPRQEGMNRNDFILFSESNSRFLAEVPAKYEGEFERHMKESGVPYSWIGKVTAAGKKLHVLGAEAHTIVSESLDALRDAWKTPLI